MHESWFKVYCVDILIAVFAVCLLSGCSSPATQAVSGVSQVPVLVHDQLVADDGYQLPFLRYWPEVNTSPEGLVIALHGFNDYSKSFDGLCQFLVLQNMACIAYDQRGFGGTAMTGLWPAAGRLQKDLKLMAEMFHQQYPGLPVFLAGESMGGAVILTAMADPTLELSKSIEGIILFAPAVWARSTQPWYQEFLLWVAVHTFPGWMPTGEGLGIQATDNIQVLREMGRDPKIIKETRIDSIYGLTNLMDAALLASSQVSVKTLVLYGEKDEVIPRQPTCEMLRSMSLLEDEVTFIHYPDGYHMLTRDLQAERVFQDSLAWMSGVGSKESQLKAQRLSKTNPLEYCH